MTKIKIAIIFCLLLLTQGGPGYAQYFGNGLGWGYYSLGTSLLWPLSSLLFPYAGYANPYNLSSSLYRLGYGGSQATLSGLKYPYYYTPSTYQYQNSYGSVWPSPPNGYPLTTPGQYSAPVWQQQSYLQAGQAKTQSTDPNDVFNTNTTTPVGTTPPVAPDRRLANPEISQPQNPAAINGFFQTVNSHYKSDLFHALDQPDMRNWAESLGLVEHGQPLLAVPPKSRKSQIATILKDDSIDPAKKLEILRLLIK